MHTTNQKPCTLVGHSIDCLTTAVVLASLGKRVVIYGNDLDDIAHQYAFEHELVALYEMYKSREVISLVDFDDFVPSSSELCWLFVSDVCFDDVDVSVWITAFNKANDTSPVILSGNLPLGDFDVLAKGLKRALVYYVPFVFLVDGQAFTSMLNPHLLLIGQKTDHPLSALMPVINGAKSVQTTDIATAEFARASVMAMLATRVSLMNELSRLADRQGVDITTISHIMGQDGRLGASYLTAGLGFGGRTLPNEMMTLQASFDNKNVKNPILSAVSQLNDDQKELLFCKFWRYFDGFIDDKTVLIVGGSYKSGSGRTDNSAIHRLLPLLWSYGITTHVAGGVADDELIRLYDDEPLFKPSGIDVDVQAIFILNLIDGFDVNRLAVGVPVFDANVLSRDEVGRLKGGYFGVGRKNNHN